MRSLSAKCDEEENVDNGKDADEKEKGSSASSKAKAAKEAAKAAAKLEKKVAKKTTKGGGGARKGPDSPAVALLRRSCEWGGDEGLLPRWGCAQHASSCDTVPASAWFQPPLILCGEKPGLQNLPF